MYKSQLLTRTIVRFQVGLQHLTDGSTSSRWRGAVAYARAVSPEIQKIIRVAIVHSVVPGIEQRSSYCNSHRSVLKFCKDFGAFSHF